MSTDDNNQDLVTIDDNDGGDGNDQTAEEIRLAKAEYEELVGYKSTVGSLKREIKELKRANLDGKGQGRTETLKNQMEDFGLTEKAFLRSAGISDAEEVQLAKETSRKWGMDLDRLVDDDDFKLKLEKHRVTKSNAKATNVDGGSGTGQSTAKNSTDYWSERNILPTAKDVPDRKTRAKIALEMAQLSKGGGRGKFYNE